MSHVASPNIEVVAVPAGPPVGDGRAARAARAQAWLMSRRDRRSATLNWIAEAVRPHMPETTRTGAALRRVRHLLARTPDDLSRPSQPEPLSLVMTEFARAHRKAFFVQVGANDGTRIDPLHRAIMTRKWSGIMIEPVPYVFERLRRNYGSHPRIALENVAIADRDGTRELYYIPQTTGDNLPWWYDGLASFKKDVLLKHRLQIPDIDDRVKTLDVRCLTFDNLCRKHDISRVDVVQVDTEGYDFEIIKLVDLARLRPTLVMFEHYHMDDETFDACVAHLRANGYEDLSNGMDTLCLRRTGLGARDSRLDRLWRRLRAQVGPGRP